MTKNNNNNAADDNQMGETRSGENSAPARACSAGITPRAADY